jgi:hypothetical protein
MSSVFFTSARVGTEGRAEANTVERAGERSRQSVWHPSRLLVEEAVLCGLIVVTGIVSLYAFLPRPKVSAEMAKSVQRLKSPFLVAGDEPVVALVPASRPMIAAIRRAHRLEQSGRFDQVTRDAWKQAAAEARRFSMQPVSTGPGRHVRLFMKEAEEGRMEALDAMLEELLPGQFAALEARREAAIAADPEQSPLPPDVSWLDVAANAPEDVREMAYDLAALHDDAARNVASIAKYRDLVGYDHWQTICESGVSESGFLARQALWRAEFEASQARFDLAKAAFDRGFEAWRDACGAVPTLCTDGRVADEMAAHRERYREVLAGLQPVAGADAETLDL